MTKKITTLLSFTIFVSPGFNTASARSAGSLGKSPGLAPRQASAAVQQPAGGQEQPAAGQQAGAEKKPQWKSREEYDDFQKMAAEKDPNKRISLAQAVLQKYPNSDFKDAADVAMMQAYQQLGDSAKAIDAGRNAVQANPDNLDALVYLSFAFPFVFKADDPQAASKLSQAESAARHGLEVLQKLQKPANVTDEQFNQFVKQTRGNFNSALGFVALQGKDYPAAITALKTAAEDNQSDFYTFYRLGLAYLYSSPPDFDNAIWNLARSVALAKAAKSPDATGIEKFYSQVYVGRHGSDQGRNDVVTQAASSVNPPEGFKVAPPEKHAATGNPNVDAFYQIQDALRVGGDQAQKTWDGLKGQPLGLNGFVDSVEKGTDPGNYLVRIVLDRSKAGTGVYNIELKDSQPGVQNLSKGDPVRFQGVISAYAVTPSFVLTLENGKINEEDLAAAGANKPKGKPKAKPKPRTAARRRPARRASQ